MNIRKFLLFLPLGAMVALAGCDSSDDPTPVEEEKPNHGIVPDDNGGQQNGDEANDKLSPYLKKYASRLEVPAIDTTNLFIQHSTLVDGDSVMTYCLEYNKTKYHSNWIAFRFDDITRQRNVKRQDDFQDDPKLPEYLKITNSTFPKGYDRGHLCASADRLFSADANKQTFYMTNMSPQISQFNQKYWVKFESQVQTWGRSKDFSDTLYVVKGGTIADDMINGTVKRSNGVEVVIPSYYYMALLKIVDGGYEAIAFWVEHKEFDHDGTLEDVKSSVVTIDELESYTGIDFFHNLPDEVEKEVESSFKLSAWGF